VSVYTAVLADLAAWGIADTSDGEIALVMAAALDDRAGVQNLAATAKRLQETMAELRERFKPREKGRLELLRGGGSSATG
jgi:hypothetical protein